MKTVSLIAQMYEGLYRLLRLHGEVGIRFLFARTVFGLRTDPAQLLNEG